MVKFTVCKSLTVFIFYITLNSIEAEIINKSSTVNSQREGALDVESDLRCPGRNGKLPVLLAHPEDCGKFYICDNGIPHLKTCQSGLHFNVKIKACDYPRNARCKASITVTKKPEKYVIDENDCPESNGQFLVMMPHETDCGKFYLCDNGVPHLKECQAGLHFNPKVQACDYPENGECKRTDSLIKKRRDELLDDFTLSCETIRKDSTSTVLLPHPTDCSHFVVCSRGRSYLQTCPAGLHFNRIRGECDYPEKAKCEKMGNLMAVGVPSPLCPGVNGKDLIFYGHPTNCSIYYMCSNGRAYEFACPARLHFNMDKKICDYEQNVGCAADENAGKKERENSLFSMLRIVD